MEPFSLSIEQQFELTKFPKLVDELNSDQRAELLVMMHRQLILTQAFIRNQMKLELPNYETKPN